MFGINGPRTNLGRILRRNGYDVRRTNTRDHEGLYADGNLIGQTRTWGSREFLQLFGEGEFEKIGEPTRPPRTNTRLGQIFSDLGYRIDPVTGNYHDYIWAGKVLIGNTTKDLEGHESFDSVESRPAA
jgi:hypothetical protein